MNIFLETIAEALDLVGAVLSLPGAFVLDLGAALHNLAYSIQHRNDNNDEQYNGDGQE